MKAVIGRQDIPGLVIMTILGLGLTFLATAKIMKAATAKKWPVTMGTITNSSVSGAIKYYPSVTYTYTVDSVAYNSNRVANMSFKTKNMSVVEDFLKKYPNGSQIQVYYNDSKPSDAFLEPGITSGNYLLSAFGLLLLAIPVLSVILMKVDLKKGSDVQQ